MSWTSGPIGVGLLRFEFDFDDSRSKSDRARTPKKFQKFMVGFKVYSYENQHLSKVLHSPDLRPIRVNLKNIKSKTQGR